MLILLHHEYYRKIQMVVVQMTFPIGAHQHYTHLISHFLYNYYCRLLLLKRRESI
ncbi:hypothetical protein GLOIN_2v1512807 [Rhizophagus irregularis DAOM 181602=DAOM 197198]|uniref:Uncharacterized protein n=1 Tax=Rhizophagus irregularis (strain DAOM 181602 / DAOM 197198 / MUCL 43194) TaxID=747089 RepID=A0A2P4QT39_RHIID|nr:hypothetical protein GLOIN_2v1512807 [Rhizophagus irregularis DAOM 181602=DAOM 197198]POG80817.1 hypothetical protein GLOIN_2v1512807 [Rhizophagus irregularis DAOM 181602=DAOM 197198]|eukprot:XP_025187683.1 hypothetical protein GLOIN_2v1512807 [Rhizophagus irregularis DAOM 181602=DAOM 197198]